MTPRRGPGSGLSREIDDDDRREAFAHIKSQRFRLAEPNQALQGAARVRGGNLGLRS